MSINLFLIFWQKPRKKSNLGTCGLHTLHNGFQHGKKASGWELKSLNAMYKIFDKSPARRADYEFTTAIESDFALQFRSHR